MGQSFQTMHNSATEKDQIYIKAIANCVLVSILPHPNYVCLSFYNYNFMELS